MPICENWDKITARRNSPSKTCSKLNIGNCREREKRKKAVEKEKAKLTKDRYLSRRIWS